MNRSKRKTSSSRRKSKPYWF